MNDTQAMFHDQMEMSFDRGLPRAPRRQRRLTRAQGWFQRMRRVVDRALDWQPVPTARPEQIWFPDPQRHAPTAQPEAGLSRPNPEERHICA